MQQIIIKTQTPYRPLPYQDGAKLIQHYIKQYGPDRSGKNRTTCRVISQDKMRRD